jgi:hypothetical protein
MKRSLAVAVLLVLTFAAGTSAQDFNWRGRIGRGRMIEIKGVNGGITAVGTSGTEVRVTAIKSAEDDDPEEVEIEVVEHDDGVTICAVYPTSSRRRPNSCEPAEGGRMNVNDNDVKVEFEVEVPAGVVLVARTVNGGIKATDIESDVRAYTVNGGVTIDANGVVEAKTVNGSIRAAMGSSNWDGDLNFETVNGGITLEIDGDLNAEVSAQTVTGGISTDFPLTVQGRFGPRSVRGVVGRGGRNLGLNTVNGGIQILRR